MWVLEQIIGDIGLDGVFFETLERQRWQRAEAQVYDPRLFDEKELEREVALERRSLEWRDLCSGDDLVLGQEMVREIEWALWGMTFANDRLDLLHFPDFPQFIGLTDPYSYIGLQLEGGTDEQMKGYRSILILFALQELYFWMAAVWDRMAHFLNLFAFGIRNVDKSREGWRQAFARFRDNYAAAGTLASDGDYKVVMRLSNKTYEKVYRRRNMLAHKGSLAGRIQAVSEGNQRHRALCQKFILGNAEWDLSNVLGESADLSAKCEQAARALLRFMGTFLRWKDAQMGVKGGTKGSA